MNIAIFNHPFSDFYSSVKRIYSENLKYLKDIINSDSCENHNIICFDVIKNLKKKIELPEKIFYLKKYLNYDITSYSFFKEYFQFGDVNNFNHKLLKKFNPEVIIISSFAFCYFNDLKKTIEYLKRLFDVLIICGGHGPSSNPEFYLKNTIADFIVIGPAELTLGKLIDKLGNGKNIDIGNVIYQGYKSKINLDLKYNFKPFIDHKKDNIIHLQLTRGCPKKCSYCSVKVISGNKFRKVNIDDLERSIAALNIKGNAHFDFEDDNILFDREYFFNIFKIIKKYYKDSTFSFENGIDFTCLNKKIIDKLIDYGIKQWNISLTSINSEILYEKGRGYLLNQFEEIISYLEKFNQPIIVYFISGLVNDMIKNILDTLFYLISKKVIIGISSFYPVPSTEEVKKIKKEIIPVLSKATSFYKWSKISTKEQITIFILSRFINSIKKIKMKEWDELKKKRVEIHNNKIISKKLTRIELSMIGILISFKKQKLLYINNELNLIPFNLNYNIIKLFFKKINQGLKIRNSENYFIDNYFLNEYYDLTFYEK